MLSDAFDADTVIERVRHRYHMLWQELTGAEEFTTDQMWRIEQRMHRLNELGFDVDELDIVQGPDGSTVGSNPGSWKPTTTPETCNG